MAHIRLQVNQCRGLGVAPFAPAVSAGLGNEYGAQDEIMVLELRPGALAAVRGVGKYCGEFSQLA